MIGNDSKKKAAAVSIGATQSGTAASGIIRNNKALGDLKQRLDAEAEKKANQPISVLHYENALKNNEALQSLKKQLGVQAPEAPMAPVQDPLVTMYGGDQLKATHTLNIVPDPTVVIGKDGQVDKYGTLLKRDWAARQQEAQSRMAGPFALNFKPGEQMTTPEDISKFNKEMQQKRETELSYWTEGSGQGLMDEGDYKTLIANNQGNADALREIGRFGKTMQDENGNTWYGNYANERKGQYDDVTVMAGLLANMEYDVNGMQDGEAASLARSYTENQIRQGNVPNGYNGVTLDGIASGEWFDPDYAEFETLKNEELQLRNAMQNRIDGINETMLPSQDNQGDGWRLLGTSVAEGISNIANAFYSAVDFMVGKPFGALTKAEADAVASSPFLKGMVSTLMGWDESKTNYVLNKNSNGENFISKWTQKYRRINEKYRANAEDAAYDMGGGAWNTAQ